MEQIRWLELRENARQKNALLEISKPRVENRGRGIDHDHERDARCEIARKKTRGYGTEAESVISEIT